MKKYICLALAALLLFASLLPVTVTAADAGSADCTTSSAAPKADFTFAGSGSDSVMTLGTSDWAAAQISLTAAAKSLSVYVSGAGRVTVGIFAFDTDVGTSLLSEPAAEHTFDGLSGKTWLTFTFDSLPAGEYVLALYDAEGVSPVTRGAHESQLLYKNGEKQAKAAAVAVSYASKPAKLYAKPTAPDADSEYDPAPHMPSAIRFESADDVTALVSSTNTCSYSFMEEDGETFVRLKPPTDADDPFVWLELPGVGAKTGDYGYLLIKCRIDDGCPTTGQVFVITDANSSQIPWANTFITYKKTTDWQYVVVKMAGVSRYTGLVTSVRLDPVDHMSGTHTIDVAYMAFFKSKEAAAGFADNFGDYETDDPSDGEAGTEAPYEYRSDVTPAEPAAGHVTESASVPYGYCERTYTMDFTETPDAYHAGNAFGFYHIENAVIADGALTCRPFTPTAFFTRKMLGDPYGLNPTGRGGELSFDLLMTHGSVTLAARLIIPNDEPQFSGLRFTLYADGTIHISDSDGYALDLDPQLDFSTTRRVTLRDTGDAVSVLVDGETAASVSCAGLRSETSPHRAGAGYASVTLDALRGRVDNVSYTYTDVLRESAAAAPVDYSTWTATDDLGRTTPTAVTVDGQKYVGLFYFMCHEFTSGRKANDVTAIYLEGGADAVTRTLSGWAGRDGAYWAEPYFGYYSSNDTWVYRKHAFMLDAAGVDFVFLDLSNNKFYVEQLTTLFDTWLDIRRAGGHTPQIAFMFGDMPFTFVNGVYTLRPFLDNPDYRELLFLWEDKPLILGNNDGTTKDEHGRYKSWTVSGTTPQSKEQFEANLNNNPAVKEFVEKEINKYLEDFTVRKCWAWQTSAKRKGYWDWLQDSPQEAGRDFGGNIEQMAVSMGTHAHTSKGRSLVKEDTSYNTLGEFGYTLGTAKYGYHFAEQFEYALSQNVQVIMITGWNEWYAGVQSGSQAQTCGGTPSPGFYMVDQMSPEYSRDGEPMRIRDGVGFGDDYYYQMVSYIRQFKGITPPAAVNGGGMRLDAEDVAAQWNGVLPLFTDHVNDVTYRNDLGWAGEYRYVNGTGRNDIASAQVSQDADKVYFYVTTAHPLVVRDDETWMNLYLNTDGDASTGWEGYDYILNRSRTDKTLSVEKFVNGEWAFEPAGSAEFVLTGNGLMLAVDKTAVGGKAGEVLSFTFKWADNADVKGDVMAFMELGDAAPDDRFAFSYNPTGTDDQRPVEMETETEADTAEPASEAVTDTGTDAPATDNADESDTGIASDGCKSAAGLSGMVLLILCGAAVLRRRDE